MRARIKKLGKVLAKKAKKKEAWVEKYRRTAKEILTKREELYSAHLVADRKGNPLESGKLLAQVKALDWVVQKENYDYLIGNIRQLDEQIKSLKNQRRERYQKYFQKKHWWSQFLSLVLILVLACPVYASTSSTMIQDRKISGNKVNVEKVGTEYGMQTVQIGAKYNICNKDDDATPYYYGFEAADGSWVIMRWTVSAGADVFAYDRGTSAYSTAWTGRAALTYQSYGTEF